MVPTHICRLNWENHGMFLTTLICAPISDRATTTSWSERSWEDGERVGCSSAQASTTAQADQILLQGNVYPAAAIQRPRPLFIPALMAAHPVAPLAHPPPRRLLPPTPLTAARTAARAAAPCAMCPAAATQPRRPPAIHARRASSVAINASEQTYHRPLPVTAALWAT